MNRIQREREREEKNMITKKHDHLYKFCNNFRCDWMNGWRIHVDFMCGSTINILKWIISLVYTFSDVCVYEVTVTAFIVKQDWGKIINEMLKHTSTFYDSALYNPCLFAIESTKHIQQCFFLPLLSQRRQFYFMPNKWWRTFFYSILG